MIELANTINRLFKRQDSALSMSFPQILSLPDPLRGGMVIRKKIINTRKRLLKIAKIRTSRIKRNIIQRTRKYYFVSTSIKDLRNATAQNEDIVVASVVSTLMLVYACSAIALQFVYALGRVTYSMSDATGFDMGFLVLAAIPMIGLFCALLAATAMSFLSYAVLDGANRKVYRTIRSTIARSLKAASRITIAWFQLAALHFVRLLAVVIPISLYIKWISDIAVLSTDMLLVLGIAGIVWLVFGTLAHSLVPYVVLFEPKYLVSESFARSRILMNAQAKVFVISLTVILSASMFGLVKICTLLKPWIGGASANLLLTAGMLTALMLANGAMVMLYRKRKLARS